MPIHLGKDSDGPFVQWGHQKKYHYKANDKKSLAAAKAKAKKQMKAIFSSGYVGENVQIPNEMKKSKFDLVYEDIVKQLNKQKQNEKHFGTFKQAENFLNKNFNGHGAIFSKDNICLHNCRCMRQIHQKMGIPKVIVDITQEEFSKSDQNPYKDL